VSENSRHFLKSQVDVIVLGMACGFTFWNWWDTSPFGLFTMSVLIMLHKQIGTAKLPSAPDIWLKILKRKQMTP
jgi:hypothetical protein